MLKWQQSKKICKSYFLQAEKVKPSKMWKKKSNIHLGTETQFIVYAEDWEISWVKSKQGRIYKGALGASAPGPPCSGGPLESKNNTKILEKNWNKEAKKVKREWQTNKSIEVICTGPLPHWHPVGLRGLPPPIFDGRWCGTIWTCHCQTQLITVTFAYIS